MPAAEIGQEASSAAPGGKEGLLAAGSLLGGILSMSCCILPLAFVTLGVGGGWLANLTALSPYQPLFLAAALTFLAAGFWTVYRRPRVACASGSHCAKPHSERVVKGALWVAALMVVATAATDFVVPLVL